MENHMTDNIIPGALLGAGENGPVQLLFSQANRHGLIAGATGTGKTVTLKVLAERFSEAGIPVLITDIKGDISSIAAGGQMNSKIRERLDINQVSEEDFIMHGFPVRFFDVYREQGLPIRISISDLGPALISRLLELSEAQQGVLNIVFKAADDRDLEITDFKDLKSMIGWARDHKDEISDEYGAISTQSINTLQRKLLAFENEQARNLFGLPGFEIRDLFEQKDGMGMITLLECSKLYLEPLYYSTIMLWLLSELFEQMPEAGDLEKPRIMIFIDEAHLLFEDTPKVLQDKIEQIIRLIRSKGVGIILVSQSPADIPDDILAQLNNRIQHALRAYTPSEQKKLKAAAAGFRENPNIDTLEALTALKTGEALVSTVDEDGAPIPVERVMIMPSKSSFAALSNQEIMQRVQNDLLMMKYGQDQDPITAYEILQEMEVQEQREIELERQRQEQYKLESEKQQQAQKQRLKEEKAKSKSSSSESALKKATKKAVRQAARSAGRQSAKAISRGLMKTSSSSARRTVEAAAGSLLADLFGSFFR